MEQQGTSKKLYLEISKIQENCLKENKKELLEIECKTNVEFK